jgi:PAS domain S-box-containing protein
MSPRRLGLLASLAVLLAAGATWLVLTSDHEDNPAATLALVLIVGLAFVVSGLIALWRRPENRTGYLLLAVGCLWFLSALTASDNDWVFSLGVALASIAFGALVHVLLAFPQGRLHGRLDVFLVAATYAVALFGGVALLLVEETPSSDCATCMSTIAVSSDDTFHVAVRVLATLLAVALLGAVLTTVVLRYRRATRALRRALGPVLVAGLVTLVLACLTVVLETFSDDAAQPLEWVFLASFATVPFAFLAGVLRSRLARSGSGDLLLELTRGTPLRDALAMVLHDPTLEIAYWLPEAGRYVTADGKPLPEESDGRHVTLVEHAGRPTAALLHDPTLAEEPELVEALVAASGLWLDNERLQAKLRAQVDFLETTVNTAPSLLCSLDREGRISNLNGAARRAAGVEDDDAVRWHTFWDVFVGPDERDLARRAFEKAAPFHEGSAFEHTFVNQLGEERTIAWSTEPLHDEQGNVRNVICGGLDVTERKKRESLLRSSEERLRAGLEASPVAIVEYALDDTITRWNPAAERMFGWSADEVVGGKARHQPAGREAELAELMRRVRAGEVYTSVESKRVRSDGAYIDVEISAAPIRDANGEVISHMALFTDITERKRQEEELRASRARIVQAGDEARRRLERNLHDGAQQRLVALSLALRIAQSKLASDPVAAEETLEAARNELAEALDELRELARGIHPAVLTDRGLTAAIEALTLRSPVPVEVETPDEPLPKSVEAAAYYVIAESLANVTKYAGASSALVRVSRENGCARVEVADDGVGGADPAQGSGLRGLADRVEALAGTLAVESTPGAGTRISAEIPIEDEHAPAV